MKRYFPCYSREMYRLLWPQKGILIYGAAAFEQVFLFFLYSKHNVPRMV